MKVILIFLIATSFALGQYWDDSLRAGNAAKLFYRFEGSQIRMKLECLTQGWIGVGWGGNDMTNTDMAILTFDQVGNHREYQLGDYYSYGFSRPTLDSQGSWDLTLVSVETNGGYTSMEFTRPLVTGDQQDNDIVIGSRTQFVWAFGGTGTLSFHNHNANHWNVVLHPGN